MPKLKTKSGAKKRFKLTATGKIKAGVAGKRHRLMSHSSKYIRQNRGTKVMTEASSGLALRSSAIEAEVTLCAPASSSRSTAEAPTP